MNNVQQNVPSAGLCVQGEYTGVVSPDSIVKDSGYVMPLKVPEAGLQLDIDALEWGNEMRFINDARRAAHSSLHSANVSLVTRRVHPATPRLFLGGRRFLAGFSPVSRRYLS